MIEELAEKDLAAAVPLVCPGDDTPEARAVILGINPGRVFVDGMPDPHAALIWSSGIGGFYLVGDARGTAFREALDAYVQEHLASHVLGLGLDWFEVSGDGPEWDRIIPEIFAGRDIRRSHQRVYVRSPDAVGLEASGIDDARDEQIEVRAVDQRLLSDSALTNRKLPESRVIRYWGSSRAFLEYGVGCAAVRQGMIVSLCFSAFVADDVHVVDVVTDRAHRRSGMARAAAGAYVSECVGRRLRLYWDCEAENVGSSRLAESLGFSRRREYVLHSFKLAGK